MLMFVIWNLDIANMFTQMAGIPCSCMAHNIYPLQVPDVSALGVPTHGNMTKQRQLCSNLSSLATRKGLNDTYLHTHTHSPIHIYIYLHINVYHIVRQISFGLSDAGMFKENQLHYFTPL